MIHCPEKAVAKKIRNVKKSGLSAAVAWACFLYGVWFLFALLWYIVPSVTALHTSRKGSSGVVDPFILCYCSLLFRAAGPERQPQERRIRPKSLRCLMLFSFFRDITDPAAPVLFDLI